MESPSTTARVSGEDENVAGQGLTQRDVPTGRDFIATVLPWMAAAVLPVICILLSDKKVIWGDECYSLLFLRDPNFGRMWAGTRSGADGGLSLYYVLGWLWGSVFGRSLLSLRLFSAIGLGAAAFVLWKTLIRRYSLTAVAVGLFAMVLNSSLLIFQALEVRFYGLYCLAAVCVVAAEARLERKAWGRRDGAVLLLAHLFLVYSHTLGIVYSLAALIALVLWDMRTGKLRFGLYACAGASWLGLLPLLPALARIGDTGKPHSWMLPPNLPMILEVYSFSSYAFIFAVLIVLLFWASARFPTRPAAPSSLVVYVALSFLMVPTVMAVESQFGTVLFVERYFAPGIFAAGLLLTATLDWANKYRRAMSTRASVLWGSLVIFLLIGPHLLASPILSVAYWVYPYDHLEQMVAQQVPASVPVIIEDANTFLPFMFYRNERSPQYYYPLDWETAVTAQSLHATVQQKLMKNWKNAGYLTNNILSTAQIKCQFQTFVVLNSPQLNWFMTRIWGNPDYEARPIMNLIVPAPDPGPHFALQVTRRNQVGCGE